MFELCASPEGVPNDRTGASLYKLVPEALGTRTGRAGGGRPWARLRLAALRTSGDSVAHKMQWSYLSVSGAAKRWRDIKLSLSSQQKHTSRIKSKQNSGENNFIQSYPMYTWALHRRLSNETVYNPDSLPSKSLPKPAGKSRGGDVRRLQWPP